MIKWGAFINPILYKYALIYFVCKIQFEENSFHYFVSQFTSSSPSYNLHGLNSASLDIALVWMLDAGGWADVAARLSLVQLPGLAPSSRGRALVRVLGPRGVGPSLRPLPARHRPNAELLLFLCFQA